MYRIALSRTALIYISTWFCMEHGFEESREMLRSDSTDWNLVYLLRSACQAKTSFGRSSTQLTTQTSCSLPPASSEDWVPALVYIHSEFDVISRCQRAENEKQWTKTPKAESGDKGPAKTNADILNAIFLSAVNCERAQIRFGQSRIAKAHSIYVYCSCVAYRHPCRARDKEKERARKRDWTQQTKTQTSIPPEWRIDRKIAKIIHLFASHYNNESELLFAIRANVGRSAIFLRWFYMANVVKMVTIQSADKDKADEITKHSRSLAVCALRPNFIWSYRIGLYRSLSEHISMIDNNSSFQ